MVSAVEQVFAVVRCFGLWKTLAYCAVNSVQSKVPLAQKYVD